jgi:broad specificity phosphatase PhoE
MLIKEILLKVVALKTAPVLFTQFREAVFKGSPECLRSGLRPARHAMVFCRLRYLLLFTLVSVFIGANDCEAGLKIYYIRHAEGGHNVKKAWQAKGVPESEWPAYVGNPDVFTPTGLKEVVKGTKKLQKYHFDLIASSPLWRARNTILPYLDARNQKAEIWPELREASGMLTILDPNLPEVKEDILNKREAIVIPKNEKEFFKLRPGAENNYKSVPRGSSAELKVAYTKYAAQHAIQLIKSRYGDSDKSILLAGHNSSGVSLLKLLIQFEPTGKARRGLDNVGIWMVEQQEDGSFELKMYNDEPYEHKVREGSNE